MEPLLNSVSLIIILTECGWQERNVRNDLVGRFRELINQIQRLPLVRQTSQNLAPASLNEGPYDHRLWIWHWYHGPLSKEGLGVVLWNELRPLEIPMLKPQLPMGWYWEMGNCKGAFRFTWGHEGGAPWWDLCPWKNRGQSCLSAVSGDSEKVAVRKRAAMLAHWSPTCSLQNCRKRSLLFNPLVYSVL